MSHNRLDLLTLDEQALVDLYATRVAPILQANEGGRVAAMGTYRQRFFWGALGSLAVAGVAFLVWHEVLNAVLFGSAALATAYWYAYQPLQDIAVTTKAQSLSAIAKAIGCDYKLEAFEPDALARFTDIGLLPARDRADFQDRFGGDHRGCGFAFYEGRLERRGKTQSGSRWYTVFRGQLIRVGFPKKFLGVTVVRRDSGTFNVLQRWATSLQRVALGDTRLEAAFEVYSTDQVEARYLIHPVFMERLLALEARFEGRRLRCAFESGDLLIAVEGEDKFELGSMFEQLDDIARVRAIVADITDIVRLIDAVLTAEQSALPPA